MWGPQSEGLDIKASGHRYVNGTAWSSSSPAPSRSEMGGSPRLSRRNASTRSAMPLQTIRSITPYERKLCRGWFWPESSPANGCGYKDVGLQGMVKIMCSGTCRASAQWM
jgi:hypothetical protein